MAALTHGSTPADADSRISTTQLTQINFNSATYVLADAAHQVTIIVPANALMFVCAKLAIGSASNVQTCTGSVFIDGVQMTDGYGQTATITSSALAGQGWIMNGTGGWDGNPSGLPVFGANVAFTEVPFVFAPSAGSHTVDMRFKSGAAGGFVKSYKMFAWTRAFG